MFRGEWKKLFGSRILWGILAILIAVNGIICFNFSLDVRASRTEYGEMVAEILRSAGLRLEEYTALGYTEDDFVYQYQIQLLDVYGRLTDLAVEPGSAPGWQRVFHYAGGSLWLAVMALVTGFYLLYADRFSGMISLVRTTRHGRARLCAVRLAVGGAAAVVFASAFLAVELLISAAGSPGQVLESVSLPLQAVPGLERCPFRLSIGGGFALLWLTRVLLFVVVMLLSAALTALFNGYLLPLAGGAAFFGVQYLLADMTFFNDYHYLNLVNYFKLYGLNFFARYSVVRFGDACITSVAAAAVTLLLMAAVCTAAVILLSAYRRYTHRKSVLSDLFRRLPHRTAPRRRRRAASGTHTGLVRHELYKLLARASVIAIAVICLGVRLPIIADWFAPDLSYADDRYRLFLEEFADMSPEETDTHLNILIKETSSLIDLDEEMFREYLAGNISNMEYSQYERDAARARDELPVLKRIQEQNLRVMAAREAGYQAVLLYETGWQRWLNAPIDYPMMFALIFLLSGLFSTEKECGVLPILRASRRGRAALSARKYGIALLCAATAAILGEIMNFCFCCHGYQLPHAAADIHSLSQIDFPFTCTIAQYAAMTVAVHLFGALLLALLIASCSAVIGRTYPVILTGCLLCFAHPVFAYLSIDLPLTPDLFFGRLPEQPALYVLWIAAAALGLFAAGRRVRKGG